ncbi:MAG: M28 family peptidase [Flavobacteriales bacterium]|nr:M28 family peptidase [Flavobacteriales bacterium]
MAAKRAGVKVLLLATPDADRLMKEMGHYIGSSRMRLKEAAKEEAPAADLQVVVIDEGVATRILAKGGITWKKAIKGKVKEGTLLPCPITLQYKPNEQELQAENVLGYVEGTDLKDELVVVTAHYDHIGMEGGEVYNGADDDGSGTVALLEMAQAFAKARASGHGPRRSVLFMPVSGEEKGLLGSEHYSEHPVFPLENTVADLNIDMIGRFDTAHKDAKPYVYIIGSDRISTELHRINEEVNSTHVGLELDYTFNAANDPNRFYYRSDHYNFARKGVPVIFYFSGVHDDYHQPGDEVDKIRFDLLEQRTKLVFATAWELANRPTRIVVDKPVKKE